MKNVFRQLCTTNSCMAPRFQNECKSTVCNYTAITQKIKNYWRMSFINIMHENYVFTSFSLWFSSVNESSNSFTCADEIFPHVELINLVLSARTSLRIKTVRNVTAVECWRVGWSYLEWCLFMLVSLNSHCITNIFDWIGWSAF